MAYIDDGFSTTVSFELAPSIKLREKTVTPPGISAGGSTDITTMRNSVWRTKAPKKLKEMTDMTFTAAYDPEVYDTILSILGVNQLITVNFADGSHEAFYGWLDSFTPSELTEGEQGTADCTIVPGNQDNSQNEVAPSYTAP